MDVPGVIAAGRTFSKGRGGIARLALFGYALCGGFPAPLKASAKPPWKPGSEGGFSRCDGAAPQADTRVNAFPIETLDSPCPFCCPSPRRRRKRRQWNRGRFRFTFANDAIRDNRPGPGCGHRGRFGLSGKALSLQVFSCAENPEWKACKIPNAKHIIYRMENL